MGDLWTLTPIALGFISGGEKGAAGKHEIQFYSDWTGGSRDARVGSAVPGDLLVKWSLAQTEEFSSLKEAGALRGAGRLRTSRGGLDEEQDTEAELSKLVQPNADLVILKELLLL